MSVATLTFGPAREGEGREKSVPAEAEEWVPAGTVREVNLEFSGSIPEKSSFESL